MIEMPALKTMHLVIRPFGMADMANAHRLLDSELGGAHSLNERAVWLQWTVLSYTQLAVLNQPPIGDRAIIESQTGELVGACGYAPCLNPFEQMSNFPYHSALETLGRYTLEVGLYYAISPAHQRRGFATEAAQALVAYAFQDLNLKRIVATTTYDNHASMRVMKKLGMWIERNPHTEPEWQQVVGVLENTAPALPAHPNGFPKVG